MTQEILLCGPASIIDGFINDVPAKMLVDMGASMSIVMKHFNRLIFRMLFSIQELWMLRQSRGIMLSLRECSLHRFSARLCAL